MNAINTPHLPTGSLCLSASVTTKRLVRVTLGVPIVAKCWVFDWLCERGAGERGARVYSGYLVISMSDPMRAG